MQLQSKKFEILDAAQEIIQRRGYNGFSFADISKAVGIQKASIHHHFPSKAALGVSVIRRYREQFATNLEQIGSNGTWIEQMKNYAKLYEDVLDNDRLCLCGMLASDSETLPKPLQKEIRGFFADNVEWLSKIIQNRYKSISNKRLNEIAWHIISTLQGGIIMARMHGNSEIFSSVARELFLQLQTIK